MSVCIRAQLCDEDTSCFPTRSFDRTIHTAVVGRISRLRQSMATMASMQEGRSNNNRTLGMPEV